MPAGPLIPGLEEFDRPRRGWPRWLTALVLVLVTLVVLVIVAGFIGGVGPLRILGQSTVPLTPVAYRTTDAPLSIEIAVTVPADGLCRTDDLDVVAYERGSRIEVEGKVIRSRSASCQAVSMGGDLMWVPTGLDSPLGSRTVISVDGRTPLPDRSVG